MAVSVVHAVGIVWPDGKVQVAPTWEAMEEQVRTAQFDPPTAEDFRQHMADRAKAWSGVEVATEGSSEDFFWELERAMLLQTIRAKTTGIDTAPRQPMVVDIASIRMGGRPLADETEKPK